MSRRQPGISGPSPETATGGASGAKTLCPPPTARPDSAERGPHVKRGQKRKRVTTHAACRRHMSARTSESRAAEGINPSRKSRCFARWTIRGADGRRKYQGGDSRRVDNSAGRQSQSGQIEG
ncbi:Hypothetical protein NTJ_10674 [Nesidiocoris tenuis]|uniref:Uncharacterized protein n=1 Tax=Nesidiocoris tenuis TaxID=355587 RepID=A0ABN7B3V0_9HEMI|nr:Hypothetical protein NTJ_10674 [Nesidiocoris tenuis]